jgi:hypothetical protein
MGEPEDSGRRVDASSEQEPGAAHDLPPLSGTPLLPAREESRSPGAAWNFAGWGRATRITDVEESPHSVGQSAHVAAHKLGAWRATAICGNDITSSVLYVAALCTLQAGVYAPVALAMVGLVLYLFRRIYGEVGSALPLNGGASRPA